MDFQEEICELCGDVKRLINCPHTHPRCLFRCGIIRDLLWPFTHYPVAIQTEPETSATKESTKPKVNRRTKPAETAKSSESTDDQMGEDEAIDDQFEFHLRPEFHRCVSTGKKARKRPASMTDSVDSAQSVREKRLRLQISPTAQTRTAGDIGAEQPANLPIRPTATRVNSVDKQLDSVGDAENNLDCVAFSNESGSSDNLHGSNDPSEAHVVADEIDMSISKLADQIYKSSPLYSLPSFIRDLVQSNKENVPVLISGCQKRIDSLYRFPRHVFQFDSPLIHRLIDTLLSVVKHHCQNSQIVTKFCKLAKILLLENRYEIDWSTESIDVLLKIGCGGVVVNWTPTAIQSALSLLLAIITHSSKDQRNLIGQQNLAVKQICQSIRVCVWSKCDGIMLTRYSCLRYLCERSVANLKSFLDAEGLCLLQDRLARKCSFNLRLRVILCQLMEPLSKAKSILPDVMANGNLEILWQMWRDPPSGEIPTFCHRIFANIITESPQIWPFAQPTLKEVKDQLKKK